MARTNSNLGFSLIELMVVTSIITVLISISLPNYAQFKIKAARSEVVQNMRFFMTALESFRAENDRYNVSGNFAFAWGGPASTEDGPVYSCSDSTYLNHFSYLGIKNTTEQCQRMRYVFSIGVPSAGNTFELNAMNTRQGDVSDGIYFWAGASIPTFMCRNVRISNIYIDQWRMTDQDSAPFIPDSSVDALKICF